jgi:hypothetical protein
MKCHAKHEMRENMSGDQHLPVLQEGALATRPHNTSRHRAAVRSPQKNQPCEATLSGQLERIAATTSKGDTGAEKRRANGSSRLPLIACGASIGGA